MYRAARTLLIGLFNSEAEHERIYNENKFNSLLTFIHNYTDLKSLPQKKREMRLCVGEKSGEFFVFESQHG